MKQTVSESLSTLRRLISEDDLEFIITALSAFIGDLQDKEITKFIFSGYVNPNLFLLAKNNLGETKKQMKNMKAKEFLGLESSITIKPRFCNRISEGLN